MNHHYSNLSQCKPKSKEPTCSQKTGRHPQVQGPLTASGQKQIKYFFKVSGKEEKRRDEKKRQREKISTEDCVMKKVLELFQPDFHFI